MSPNPAPTTTPTMTTTAREANGAQRLADWYAAKCDGDWEHSNGFKLTCLDNPGYWLEFEFFCAMPDFGNEAKGKRDGIEWDATGDKFIAYVLDPERLDDLLGFVADLLSRHDGTAEAGTVASESGLNPRELLEQRDELLAALEPFAKFACDPPCGCYNCIARAAIRSVKPDL